MNFDTLVRLIRTDQPVGWSSREAMLYALAVGLGDDPLDPAALRFLIGPDMQAVPTLVTVAAYAAGVGDLGLDKARLLHSAQEVRFLRAVPAAAQLLADSRVLSVHDKGADKGAVIRLETTLRDRNSGEVVAILVPTLFARGDGGFGRSHGEAVTPHKLPDCAPDDVIDYPTTPDRALLYRLLGDRNPIHDNPAIARRAGFNGPILHGMCSYGMACRAIVMRLGGGAMLRSLEARFVAPFYPGETLRVETWRGDGVIGFRARARERDQIVLDSGLASIAPG